MRNLVLFATVALATTAIAEDLVTASGKKYTGVTITRVEPDGLSITHDDGLVKVFFADLSPELQKKYAYDPEKAAAYAAASATARQQGAAMRAAQARDQELQQGMEKLRAGGLVSQVTIRQVTPDGILGDGMYLEATKTTDTITLPGTSLDRAPRTKQVTRDTQGWASLGYIFIPGVGKNLIDGETWKGKLWPAGTYRYTTAIGGSKTIRCFAATPEAAIARLRATGETPR